MTPLIVGVVAATPGGLIGYASGALPWRCAADMRHFRAVRGKSPVVMGMTTAHSLPAGMILRGSSLFVVTRKTGEGLSDISDKNPSVTFCGDPETALDAASSAGGVSRIIVAGGASIYSALWHRLNLIVYTRISRPDAPPLAPGEGVYLPLSIVKDIDEMILAQRPTWEALEPADGDTASGRWTTLDGPAGSPVILAQ